MPDLILSSAMDSFLSESDPANVLLPLTGGTMSTGADIAFANGSMLREGTTDAGNGGAGGIAQVCSISYELKWEAGRLYVMEQDGFTIRVEQYGFTFAPTTGDDDTKGYIVGSQRILDDGTIYVCTDATTGAALWVPVINFSDRRLYAPNGTPVIEWGEDFSSGEYGIAFGYDGMGGFYHLLNSQGINWAGGSWYDGTTIGYGGLTAIDISGRQLISSAGGTSASWEDNRFIVPDYFQTLLVEDSSSYTAIQVNSRQLITSDGTTAVADWSNGGLLDSANYLSANWFYRYLYTASGIICVDWSNYMLVDSSGSQASLDWEARGIYDSSGAQSLGWSNRQLIASDGSTIAADWSTGTPAFAQGVSYTPTAYASLPATPVEGTVCYINDASTPVSLGAVVTDGGSEKVLACFNGTDWKVIAHL